MSLAHLDGCGVDDDGRDPRCPGCRAERRLAAALDRELAPRGDDDRRLARAVATALLLPIAPAPIATAGAPTAAAPGLGGWAVGAWVLGAAATSAIAATLLAREAPSEPRAQVVVEQEIAPTPARPPASAPTRSVPHAPPITSAPVEPPVATARPKRRRARAELASAPSVASAAELFASATSARKQSRTRDAIALYRRLIAEHRESREALVADVALARLLLDLRDPSGALQAYERYLARAPTGTLAEEAWVGKAVALRRLGRGDDEAAAWRELLARFPDAVARDRAQRRLDELAR